MIWLTLKCIVLFIAIITAIYTLLNKWGKEKTLTFDDFDQGGELTIINSLKSCNLDQLKDLSRQNTFTKETLIVQGDQSYNVSVESGANKLQINFN